MNTIEPKYEPISLKNHRIPEFLRFMRLEGPVIEVPKLNEPLPIGLCYWNVDTMIRKHGGSMVLGWEVSIWRKSHISAMHHAIWKSPTGELLDVTDTYPTTQIRTHSTFVADDSIKIDLERAPHVPGRIMPVTKNSRTLAYVETLKILHELDKKIADILFDHGYRCENQFAMAQGLASGTNVQNLDALLRAQSVIEPLLPERHSAAVMHGNSINALNAAF